MLAPLDIHARDGIGTLELVESCVFGGGPRQCIGNSFALLEAQLLLATVAQRYQLRLLPGHRVEPRVLLTVRPRYGLPMTLHAR